MGLLWSSSGQTGSGKDARRGLKAVRARARASRGGPDGAKGVLVKLLVDNYAESKAAYDALDEEGQAAADEALGEELAAAFKVDQSLCLMAMENAGDDFDWEPVVN